MTSVPIPGLDVTLERDLPCRMADGVSLLADVYRPASGGPHPVLLISQPYDKRAAESNFGYAHPAWYARHGYVVVAQDCRGRYGSEGTFVPFAHEAEDLATTIAWARTLPGADGRVATYGFSYPGLNQLLVAQHRPEGLVAIAPAFTGGSPYREWFYPGGAFSLAFAATWANFLALDVAARRQDDAALTALAGGLGAAAGLLWALPLTAYPPLAGGDATYYADWLAHPTLDEYWQQFEVDHGGIDLPGLHVGGWYDVFVRGTVRSFTELHRAGLAPQKLVLGPWHHMPWAPLAGAGDEDGGRIVDDWHLRFYDHVLGGKQTGVFDAPVTAFVLRDGWRDLDAWPPSASRPVDWYLHSGGRAMSVSGDGVLSEEPPGREPADVFTYDPGIPSLSAGGHSCCVEGISPMGPADQGSVERTKLVLVYSSAPLGRDLELIGDVHAVLFAASDAPDTDFTAKLCVVDAGGRSTNLLEGIVRARSQQPVPLEPGRVAEYRIDLGPIGVRIAAGERLRIQVSSSDFPQFDRNLNTGGPLGAEPASAARSALQVVLHDSDRPSRIVLPVVED